MISLLTATSLQTKFGQFNLMLFYDGLMEVPVLTLGQIHKAESVLCRVHSTCINGHYFNSTECDCQTQMETSMAKISEAGQGIIILMPQEGKGNGYLALLQSKPFKEQGMKQADAYVAAGYQSDARSYQAAAQVLGHLGVRSIALLTDGTGKVDALKSLGVHIAQTVSV